MGKLNVLIFFILLFSACSKSDKKKTYQGEALHEEKLDFQLSKDEVFAQHLIVKCNKDDLKQQDSLVNWIVKFQPGGLTFSGWPIETIQDLSLRLDSMPVIKPFFIADFFETIDEVPYPIFESSSSFKSGEIFKMYGNSGINWVEFDSVTMSSQKAVNWLNGQGPENNICPVFTFSTKYILSTGMKSLKRVAANKNTTLKLDVNNLDTLPIKKFKRLMNHNGLIIVNAQTRYNTFLNAGADLVLVKNRNKIDINRWTYNKESVKSAERILTLKAELKKSNDQNSAKALKKYTRLHFNVKSTALLSNKNKLVPMKKIRVLKLDDYLKKGLPSKTRQYIMPVPKNINRYFIDSLFDQNHLKKILFVFSEPNQYNTLKDAPNLCFNAKGFTAGNKILKEQLRGNITIDGDLVLSENQRVNGVRLGSKEVTWSAAEYAGIDSEKLRKITTLVNQAIRGKAFPGCQILAVKNGVVVYDKVFGTMNYDRRNPVRQDMIYDLASLTKVVSTTLVGMKLYELGEYRLEDSIGKFLPDTLKDYLKHESTIRNITFQELLTHKSGLPSGFPIINYMRTAANEELRFESQYCDYQFENYSTEVAEGLFMDISFQDSMWLKLNSLWVDTLKEYKYSDVNMNVLYFLFRSMIEKNPESFSLPADYEGNYFELFLNRTFYKPLGLSKTGFNPLKRFDKSLIVPTENDRFWRKQQLQGYVHDPNAAFHGGIAGNAGIFSNTHDLAVLCEMILRKGEYGGNRYLNYETIKQFTMTQPESHRGLGFNKRTLTNAAYAMSDSSAVSTYGHTGFTGTCFWIDPENKLTYIFLSNRVYPRVTNKIYEYGIRKNIHQVFYDAMLF